MNPIDQRKVSILNMAQGALNEEVNVQLAAIAQNILDPNTPHKTKRALTIKLEFATSEDRSVTSVTASAVPKLAASKPISTQITFGADVNGELAAVELTRHTPGQINLGGSMEPDNTVFAVGAAQ